MKPRNNTERLLVRLAGKLPPATDRQKQWAFRNCFTPTAIYTRRGYKVKCLCCGYETAWDKTFLDSFIDVGEYDCPGCNHTMAIEEKLRKHPMTDRAFFSVITTFRGRQLIRTFEVVRDNSGISTRYSIHDIFQSWILDNGKEVITGCPHHRSPFILSFDYSGPVSIKHHNASTTGYYQMDDLFNVCGNYFYPKVRVTPLLRRNGWGPGLMDSQRLVSMADVMVWLIKSPDAEMLCKTGQMDLFLHMVRGNKMQIEFRHAVCIANRRGYVVDDASLWLDTLRMAERLGLDTHSPSVVCPADLLREHDRLLARVARLDRKLNRLKDAERAGKQEEAYRHAKAAFLDISIHDGDMHISVLPSVRDILDEGEAMHHCVFTANYHEKPGSLILSARDGEGNRIETVELSTDTFKVLQSRGACNNLTPHHDRIIRLVEENAPLFRKAAANTTQNA